MSTDKVNSHFLRTAAVLYADDNQHVSVKSIHKKIIEATFLEVENKKVQISGIIDFCSKNYKLTFSEDEIIKIINDPKNSEDFIVQHKTGGEEVKVNLSERRYKTLQEKEKANSIDQYIDTFIIQLNSSETKFDIKQTIYRYLYELLHTNITSFSKLTKSDDSDEEINVLSNSFPIEQREVINSFLNWDNAEKNKALFSIVSYSIEYCLLTNKKDGNEFYLKGIKDKILYLDTSILFRVLGLNGKNRQVQTLAFLQKCIENGEKILVSKYTDVEFKEAVDFHINQIKKIPTGRVNPKLFEQISRSTGIYELYHKWRVAKSNSGYELFKAYIFDLYKKFETEFKVIIDYKIPFDEKDEKIIKQINEYAKEIGSHKSKEGAGTNHNSTNLTDAQNIYFLEIKRGDNCRNISDTKFFFVSADQILRKWDFNRSISTPIILLPSQWMSVLLKYISRSSDDYKSFISFLNLKQAQPIIRPEVLHVVLAGISEITEDFEYQESIIHRMVEIKFEGIVSNNTQDQDIIENAKSFTKNILEAEIEKLKESDAEHREKISKIEDEFKSEVEQLKDNIKLHKTDKTILIDSKLSKALSSWKNGGKLALVFAVLIIIWGILEFLPTWPLNFPGQIANWIDSTVSESRKDLLKAIHVLIFTGIAVTLFVVWYRRHYDKKHIKEFKENFDPFS